MSYIKQKFALWLTPEGKEIVEQHYRQDNCQSRSEFIEKAIHFYCGYLDAQNTGDYLPRVLAEVLEGSFNTLAKRMGRMQFKQLVETAMIMHILAADSDMDLERLNKLKGRCVQDVLRTNGEIDFGDILRFQKRL